MPLQLPFNLLTSFFGSPGIVRLRASIESAGPMEVSPATVYNILRAYYENNGLYDELAEVLQERGEWHQAMKPLRNPAYRIVEFYVDHVWPGMLPEALPIVPDAGASENIAQAIQQVWTWSNWGASKQLAVRQIAQYGDLFIKVSQTDDLRRVFLQLIEPQFVIDFDEDTRGFLTWIRIDVPVEERDETTGEVAQSTRTEIWSKTDLRIWTHDQGSGADVDQLGDPDEMYNLPGDVAADLAQPAADGETRPGTSLGIDFIPIVHVKFRDVGDKRGAAAILLALDKIDEANASATRLHQMLFRHNKPTWRVNANAADSMGRPLPAPTLAQHDGDLIGGDTFGVVDIGDEQVYYLPGMSTMEPMVPPIDYGAALAILDAMMAEIEKDAPELTYYRLQDMGELSGVAIELMLASAVAKALEVRGNMETGLARANAIALTIGQLAGLSGFEAARIGTYTAGSFEHRFATRRVIPMSNAEMAETVKALVDAGWPLSKALERVGLSKQEIAEVLEAKADEELRSQTGLATALAEMQRRVNTQDGEGFVPSLGRAAAQVAG